MALLLQSEGYTRPLCDWSLDTWDLFQNITISTPIGPILFNVPYFYTRKGLCISILIYDNSNITTIWDSIPGICIYSLGFTIISKKDLTEVKTIRLYKFYNFPIQNLNSKTPLNYINVFGQDLYLTINCNPYITNTSFILFTNTYL